MPRSAQSAREAASGSETSEGSTSNRWVVAVSES